MHRRDFLRFTGLASAGLAFPSLVPTASAQYSDKWRTYEVTTRVEVLKPAGVTRVWLPTPLTTDTVYLKALGNSQQAEGGTAGTAMDPRYGAGIVWAEWDPGVKPVLVLTSRFSTRDVAVDLSKPGNAKAEDPAVLAKYVAATDLMPTDTWLTTLSLDQKGVELTGQAAAASGLIPLLENSPRLESVGFVSPVTRGRDKEQFRIRAGWEAGGARAAATAAGATPPQPPPAAVDPAARAGRQPQPAPAVPPPPGRVMPVPPPPGRVVPEPPPSPTPPGARQ